MHESGKRSIPALISISGIGFLLLPFVGYSFAFLIGVMIVHIIINSIQKARSKVKSNEEAAGMNKILKMIADESNDAIDRTYNILKTRIDRFGVTQPNIQKLSTAFTKPLYPMRSSVTLT